MVNVQDTAEYKQLYALNQSLLIDLKEEKALKHIAIAKFKKLKDENFKLINFAMNEGLHLPTSVDFDEDEGF